MDEPGRQPAIELAILAELTADLAAADGVEAIAAKLERAAKWVLPADRCSLILLEDGGGWRIAPGDEHGLQGDVSGALSAALDRWAPLAVLDGELPLQPASAFADGARSALILPLGTPGARLGALLLSARAAGSYPRQVGAVGTLLGLNVAAALRNALQTERLRQASEMKTRLLATVSHDYKGPLAAIAGFSELLLEREYSSDERQRMLRHVHDAALRLGLLVDDLLDLSRATLAGPTAREPLDFPQLVEVAAAPYRDAPGRRHELAIRVAAVLPTVLGDPKRIVQLLDNLIGNAVKYSPEGGEVLVDVHPCPDRPEVQMVVHDQGIGIAPDAVNRLFQPFVRTDEAVNSGIPGTGLGLAICREIAEAHGGRIWAASPGPNLGTRVTVALPIHHP